jgi:hypothetical protein
MNFFGRLIGLDNDDVARALINGASIHPIPVQSFPIVDDMRFEKENVPCRFLALWG